MKRLLLFALTAAVVLPFAPRVRAQSKTDFSGTWTLDASRSDAPMGRGGRGGGGGGGRGGGPIVISQTATDITIGMATYKLDGSESVNEGRGGQAKSKAHWDGAKLVIETSREMQGMAMTSKEVRSLSADGKDMTVETAFSTPQGDRNQKQVFTKGM
jgi:hypothetical protein